MRVRDAWKTWMGAVLRHRIGRIALAPVLLGLALPPSLFLHAKLPHSEEYLFLAAVVATAWLGGWVPGLLSAVLAPFVLDYFFIPPLHTLDIGPREWPYLLPLFLSALVAAWVSSTRTASCRTQDLLRQSEAKFRRILTNLPDIAWTWDTTGRVVYISPKCEKTLGYTNQEIYSGGGQFFLGRVHPADLRRIQTAMDDMYLRGGGCNLEFRFHRKDDVWIWLHSRAVSYQVRGVSFADGVMSDISQRKHGEMELRAKTAFLEAQTNATIDGILVVDANGQRILQNRRFNEIFSIPPELLDSDDDAPVLEHVRRQVREPDRFFARVMHLYTHPDETGGDEIELVNGIFLERYTAPVRGGDGSYYGRIWTFRDITERRRNEDALRQLSAAVEQSPVSVIITDPQGKISYVNRKFTESTGYAASEVLGKNPRILNSGHSPREMYTTLWETIREGREWRGEFRNRKKNGELYWEAATISPITDPDGSISHFLAVKEDITERLALEGELRQAQKLEGIGQLAAGIAHEINTPIQFVADNLTFLEGACSSIFGLLESCRPGEGKSLSEAEAARARAEADCDLEFLRAEVPQAIEQSLEGTRRVATIVRAMKEFSHPDVAEKTYCDLNQGIASTLTIARPEWKDVAEMASDFDETLPPVLCHPGEINQVVLNLIVNAAHAIRERPEKAEKGQITVRTRRRGEFAEIAVSDTGAGIPADIQGRIFEPFFTTREVGSGTGQGLALAHSVVVRKHEGKIWFETEVGRGTTFFIHLPIDPGRGRGGK
jgi:PAS domain S-box-containing protein